MCISGWRVGFNSLCALASVNHLHLHAWYLNQRLYIESMVSDWVAVVQSSAILHSPRSTACSLKHKFMNTGRQRYWPAGTVNSLRLWHFRRNILGVYRVHRVLEKSLKVLEFWKINSRPLKVLENRVSPWKVLEFCAFSLLWTLVSTWLQCLSVSSLFYCTTCIWACDVRMCQRVHVFIWRLISLWSVCLSVCYDTV